MPASWISGAACANPATVSMPITIDGARDLCRFTTGTIAMVNSWNNQSVTINGANYTNIWTNSLPAGVDGGCYIPLHQHRLLVALRSEIARP